MDDISNNMCATGCCRVVTAYLARPPAAWLLFTGGYTDAMHLHCLGWKLQATSARQLLYSNWWSHSLIYTQLLDHLGHLHTLLEQAIAAHHLSQPNSKHLSHAQGSRSYSSRHMYTVKAIQNVPTISQISTCALCNTVITWPWRYWIIYV